MTKTEIQIERDFYQLVSQSQLGASLRGAIYRSEMRPADSEAEDLIVKFLAGRDTQVQTGTIVFNIYVPDIVTADGRKVADKHRLGELQELVLDFLETYDSSEYWLTTEQTPYTDKNTDIEQHLIVVRLTFQRIS